MAYSEALINNIKTLPCRNLTSKLGFGFPEEDKPTILLHFLLLVWQKIEVDHSQIVAIPGEPLAYLKK